MEKFTNGKDLQCPYQKTAIICSLLLWLIVFDTYAAIISLNDSAFGDSALTRDTNQGLDFLDLEFSKGLSFDDVSAQLGIGNTFDGFRFATQIEVITLVNNFGFIPMAVPRVRTKGTTNTDQISILADYLTPR